MQLNLDIFRDDKNTRQSNTQKTTKNQESIPKGKQYVKEKVLIPPVCLRHASDHLCGILSFDVTM